MDPQTTTWFDLADKGMLHYSVEDSLNKYGYVAQEELVIASLKVTSLTWPLNMKQKVVNGPPQKPIKGVSFFLKVTTTKEL